MIKYTNLSEHQNSSSKRQQFFSHPKSNLEHTAILIKVVPEQSGKVEYEHEKLAESDD